MHFFSDMATPANVTRFHLGLSQAWSGPASTLPPAVPHMFPMSVALHNNNSATRSSGVHSIATAAFPATSTHGVHKKLQAKYLSIVQSLRTHESHICLVLVLASYRKTTLRQFFFFDKGCSLLTRNAVSSEYTQNEYTPGLCMTRMHTVNKGKRKKKKMIHRS
jgi:hypothetical protein